MVDFGLNEEERMIQELAHEFAVKEIRPRRRSTTTSTRRSRATSC